MSDDNTARPVLELSRIYPVPPERVFDAWIGSEWASWLPPAGATCELVVHEPKVGGRFETRMVMPDARLVKTSGVYREIDRPVRLVFTWMTDYADVENLIELTFAPEGSATRMSLRHSGFSSSDLRDAYRIGWNGPGGSFDKLATLLETTHYTAATARG